MIRSRSGVAVALVLLACCGEARAQLPQIRLDRIVPLGGEAGSEVVVEISGNALDDVKTLHFDAPGFQAELIKPNQFKVKIAADVPSGAYDLCAVGKYGISAGRLFAVSRGLTEVQEKEPNDTPDKAQEAPSNCAINGRSDGNGDDYFRFPAKKGERIVVDCRAFRLDSTLRAVLTLVTSGGKELAQSKPYYDRTDPLLDVVIPDDGTYLLRIHDATFTGDLPYRLIVGNHPQIENAFPCAVIPGETTELSVFGRNLPAGTPAGEFVVNGLPLDQTTIPFTAPNAEPLRGFSLIAPLPSPVLSARGMQAWPKGFENALNPITLLASDAPVSIEREPNDRVDQAQEIALPAVVSGRFQKAADADWYTFKAKAGEKISLGVFCERLNLPGDPRAIVFNDKGQELTTLDDHGIRFNSLDMYNRDPQGTFDIPADGTYRILVQETYGNGGPRFLYALRVAKIAPDFFPVVFHETPSDPTCPTLRQGGSAFVEFCLNRRDGFAGPVTVEAEGLPPGVTCLPIHVSPQTEFADVVFTAAADAPEWSGAIRLKAWATIDGKRVERPVQCSRRRWAIANISTSRASREIALAVRPKAPYGLKLPAGPISAVAGRTLETKATVERYWPDFKGKVQLNGLNLPPGFGFGTTDLPEGNADVPLKFTVADNVPPGDYTLVLRGDAQVPFSPDPKATNKPNVRVADPSTPLTVTVTAAPKK